MSGELGRISDRALLEDADRGDIGHSLRDAKVVVRQAMTITREEVERTD